MFWGKPVFHIQGDEVLAAIQQCRARCGRPIVVAIDGGSGAGKSTLASALRREPRMVVIPLDDFFSAHIPDQRWDEFSIEEKLQHAFDWQRLRRQVIDPLRAGKAAVWYAFDFESGLRADGTYGMQQEPKRRQPGDVIVIEGAYAAGPALADLVDLAILVDVPVEERSARLAAREERDFLQQWHRRWDAVERFYFTEVRPRSSFDLVVRG